MDTTVVDESCKEEPEIIFDVNDESERHEDAEQALAPTDTATASYLCSGASNTTLVPVFN